MLKLSLLSRAILIFIIASLIHSCSVAESFEKEFYERVSGIKFRDRYKLLESFNNGEWLASVVLKIDNSTFMKS